jgi:glycerol-3-phosphate dehydrogenase
MFCTAVLFKLRSLLFEDHHLPRYPMNPSFSARRRPAYIQMFQQTPLDLLVIGGGITGAGIALDARTRGLHVGLVEMQDFAAGTSSRSTKLVHGGLRYLKQFELKLVAEVGRERAIVHANAPHVTHPVPMLLPLTRGGSLRKWEAALALSVYDFLAGVKPAERRRMLSAAATLKQEPLLDANGLLGGALYYEYRTDDARLTLEILKEAVHRGALALNYAKATGFLYENGKISGATITDELTGESFSGAGPAGGERRRPLGRCRGYAQ